MTVLKGYEKTRLRDIAPGDYVAVKDPHVLMSLPLPYHPVTDVQNDYVQVGPHKYSIDDGQGLEHEGAIIPLGALVEESGPFPTYADVIMQEQLEQQRVQEMLQRAELMAYIFHLPALTFFSMPLDDLIEAATLFGWTGFKKNGNGNGGNKGKNDPYTAK